MAMKEFSTRAVNDERQIGLASGSAVLPPARSGSPSWPSLRRRRYAFLVSLAFAVVAPTVASAPTELKPVDLFSIRAAMDPQVSPDGKHIVYVQIRPDIVQDEFTASLWVVDTDGSNHRPMTDPKEGAANPRWSPDGRRIAFFAMRDGARQIVVRWIGSGLETLIGGFATPPTALEWSPDGKWLAFAMLEPAPRIPLQMDFAPPPGATWKAGPLVIDRAMYRADGRGYLPRGETHLFIVSADGGAIRKLTPDGSGEPSLIGRPFAWLPDSSALVASLTHRTEREILNGHMFDTGLFLVPIEGRPMQTIIDRDGPEDWPSVSPDGRYIAYAGFDEARRSYTVPKLYVFDRKTGDRRLIAGSLDRDTFGTTWAPDGKGIYAVYSDHGVNHLALFDLDGACQIVANDLGFANTAYMATPSFSVSRNGVIALQWAVAASTGEIAVAHPGSATVVNVTHLNDALLSDRKLGRIEEFNYRSSEGNLPIQGWILYPPGFDPALKKYPLILEIHGGPAAGYGPRFDPEKQLMAAAGYVVVYVNPRGSTGYGQTFGNLLQDDYPGHEYEDLMSGVDTVVARGFIDPKRLYVTGGSGGGTLAAWLIAHTDRFRAAAVLYPVVDWQSDALTSDILPIIFSGFFHGTPWTQPDLYRQHSLLTSVDRVHTPVLVMTGEADYRTPISESEQYFAALRYHGVESMFVRFPAENHGLRMYPSHFAGKVSMITKWFDDHE